MTPVLDLIKDAKTATNASEQGKDHGGAGENLLMNCLHQEGTVVYTAKAGKSSRIFPALEWLAAMCFQIPYKLSIQSEACGLIPEGITAMTGRRKYLLRCSIPLKLLAALFTRHQSPF